jgi:hypothetical protein
MKLVTEYLERAVHFERLAAAEKDPAVKEQMKKQAEAYHKLAAKRAAEMNMPLPPKPPSRSPE